MLCVNEMNVLSVEPQQRKPVSTITGTSVFVKKKLAQLVVLLLLSLAAKRLHRNLI